MATPRKKKVEEVVVEVQETTAAAEEVKAPEKEPEVLHEMTHQLVIFSDFIYNVQEKDAEIIVENLGYGDVYVSEGKPATVGNKAQRILFRERKSFRGVEKLFFLSGSQPVISIIEVK